MRDLISFETIKLLHERQFYFAVLLIVADLTYVYFFFTDPDALNMVSDSAFANWLNSGTSDTAFILYFLGLATASIFTTDYTYRTYQNFIPYTGMSRVVISKIIVNLIALLVLLLLWYFIAIIYAAIKSGTFDMESIRALLLRIATQYPHVVFNGGILAIVAAITRHRGITNAALILSWVAYGFIPIAGIPFYAYVSRSIAWNATPNATLVIFFVCFATILYVSSEVIANKREVLF